MSERSAYLTIGRLSSRSGVAVETVRYYERIGLLAPPPRTPGGHRVYDHAAVLRLRFVRRCRELGFGLTDIRALLAVADGVAGGCSQVRALTAAQLDQVRAKIADLGRLEAVLAEMVDQCDTGQVPGCPVLDDLFGC